MTWPIASQRTKEPARMKKTYLDLARIDRSMGR